MLDDDPPKKPTSLQFTDETDPLLDLTITATVASPTPTTETSTSTSDTETTDSPPADASAALAAGDHLTKEDHAALHPANIRNITNGRGILSDIRDSINNGSSCLERKKERQNERKKTFSIAEVEMIISGKRAAKLME